MYIDLKNILFYFLNLNGNINVSLTRHKVDARFVKKDEDTNTESWDILVLPFFDADLVLVLAYSLFC